MVVHPEMPLRPITIDELPALVEMVESVFLSDSHEDGLDIERDIFEPDRSLAVFDGDEPVASAGAYSKLLTVPGGPIPIAAVTAVAVAPTHRRRGLLTRMMRHQLDEIHEQGGESVAALWASEAGIYSRFGYGMANRNAQLRVSTAESALRRDVDRGTGRLRQFSAHDGLPAMAAIHEEARSRQVGYLDRTKPWWDRRLFDPERRREGASALRCVVHSDETGNPDGYSLFSVKSSWTTGSPGGSATIRDLVATTPQAYAAVWGFLLELDLVRHVEWERAAADEPLIYLVDNPRGVRQEVSDALWVRLIDVDRAMSARRYSTPVDVVLEVSDEFCPWNTGRYRLTGGPDSADCPRTDDPAELTMSSTTLAAAYLGGVTLASLAAGGLVTEHRRGALAAASAALGGARQPSCPEVF